MLFSTKTDKFVKILQYFSHFDSTVHFDSSLLLFLLIFLFWFFEQNSDKPVHHHKSFEGYYSMHTLSGWNISKLLCWP